MPYAKRVLWLLISVLVLIDGPIQFKDLSGTELRRVLNTRAEIYFDTKKSKYYLNVMDGWMEVPDVVSGPLWPKIPDNEVCLTFRFMWPLLRPVRPLSQVPCR